MKKITAIFLSAILVILTGISSVASDSKATIEYFPDGSYTITTLTVENNAKGSKTGTKNKNFYNSNNVLAWTATITGTFTYTGSSATCTAATPSHTIYDTSWRVTSETGTRSGNKAIGDFTFKKYTLGIPTKTENVKLVITCSANGTLS